MLYIVSIPLFLLLTCSKTQSVPFTKSPHSRSPRVHTGVTPVLNGPFVATQQPVTVIATQPAAAQETALNADTADEETSLLGPHPQARPSQGDDLASIGKFCAYRCLFLMQLPFAAALGCCEGTLQGLAEMNKQALPADTPEYVLHAFAVATAPVVFPLACIFRGVPGAKYGIKKLAILVPEP